MRSFALAAFFCASFAGSHAVASDADFLQSIEGQWTGGGTALAKLGGSNIKVSCKMTSDANRGSFSMDGTCRALAVVSRSFNAKVRSSGTAYSGTYVGISGKPSKLSGARKGDTISFDVTWANVVYGDRKATMTIQKIGDSGLRIQTIDKDPGTGKTIVTTRLDMRRS